MVRKPRPRALRRRRALALLLAAALPAALVPAGAAEKIGDGVAPTYDEAYYATVDYYGNLTEGSVVKSYALNGETTLTDYGAYDQVVNLTDGTVPTARDGATTFDFSGEDAPSHFYFEGKTARPFDALPWKISLSYTLNGVPAKAEELAGKTGVVEISLDIVPNEDADDYAKNNYTLEAAALFNQDDILSLKAEGAQVQLVGNLRAVLFLALPGEERHFAIEVGADSFRFDGMTFLMVPATLAQLDEIAKLSDRKDELEQDYKKLNQSLDTTLDALNSMTGSLYQSARGLDKLNGARGTVSAGKGTVYDGIDLSKLDLESIASLLDPVAAQVQSASGTLTASKDILKKMSDTAVSLRTEVSQTRNALKNLEDDGKDLKDLAASLKNMSGSLDSLESALDGINEIPSVSSPLAGYGDLETLRGARDTVASLESAYRTATAGDSPAFTGTFQDFVLAQVGGDQETCQKLMAVYAKRQQMGEDAFDFLLDNSGSVDELLEALNGTTGKVNETMGSIAGPTADVIGRLSSVCDEMNALYSLADDGQDLAHIGQPALEKADALLADLDALQKLLSDYEPRAQESLKTVEDLSVTAAGSIRNAEKLITDTEELAKTSGAQLDEGTKQTLEGLAATLRRTAAALATSGEIKSAKNNLDDIITNTWDEHTGDIDNLLNMDSTASARSLTSARNPAPQSVQVLIRSQEIKVPDKEDRDAAASAADKGGFWDRVGRMFRAFWSAVTGIFH